MSRHGGAYADQTVVVPGDATADHQQVSVGVHSHHLEVADGHARVAHATEHPHPLDDLTGIGACTDRSVMSKRLVGSVGWSNTGRTFDGARARYQGEKAKLDAFWMKITERGQNENIDHDFFGLYGSGSDPFGDEFVIALWRESGVPITPWEFGVGETDEVVSYVLGRGAPDGPFPEAGVLAFGGSSP